VTETLRGRETDAAPTKSKRESRKASTSSVCEGGKKFDTSGGGEYVRNQRTQRKFLEGKKNFKKIPGVLLGEGSKKIFPTHYRLEREALSGGKYR